MEGYPDPDSRDPVVVKVQNCFKLTGRKFKIILVIILIAAGAVASYYIYLNYFLRFTTLSVLNYDSQKAVGLLKNKDTLAFTRKDQLLIGNLAGEELLLIPSLPKFGQQSAVFKISQSGNYITWQSGQGILGLNILSRKVFLIAADLPRQSYDLSPDKDKILFLTKTKLLEVNLGNGFLNQQILLPKLTNPKGFNHVKYSPTGQLAYLRSIHHLLNNKMPDTSEDLIVNFKTNSMTFLATDFTNPVGLAPAWSNDSQGLFLWRENSLKRYDIPNEKIEDFINHENFWFMNPYAVNPQNGSMAFLATKPKIEGQPYSYNPTVAILNSPNQPVKTYTDKMNQLFDKGSSSYISDIGWLDTGRIWFAFSRDYLKIDLWTVDINTNEMKKVLSDISFYSLESVYLPIMHGFTLTER